jgi:hypothetical protein
MKIPGYRLGGAGFSTQSGRSDPHGHGARRLLAGNVFLAGFGTSLLLLVLEYLTVGEFFGWLILVPTNPTIFLGAVVGHQAERLVGPRWADEAFFGTIALESALWWYGICLLVVAWRDRQRRRSVGGPVDSRRTS